MKKTTKMKIAGSLLAGAVIGGVTALLLAPASGKETRKAIAQKSKEVTDEMAKGITETTAELKKTYNEKLDQLAGFGKSSIKSIKEKIGLADTLEKA